MLLTWEARLILRRFKPKIIAVTGSVGKTTTKDAIYAAISAHVHVRKSDKSMNSEIGVPLTIIGCKNAWWSIGGWAQNLFEGLKVAIMPGTYPEWLVLEVGADHPGDIRRIASWLKPDIAVITSIPDIPVHVEFFSSPDDLAKEKRQLVVHVKPGGKLIIKGDEKRTQAMHSEFRGIATSFGFGSENDYSASHDEFAYENGHLVGLQFRVNHGGSSVPIMTPGALGKAHMYAALAALACADLLKIDLISAAGALRESIPPPGRMRIIPGLNGATIIDDTYNSSPAAVHAALETLINIPKVKKRIAILGDMLELGKFSTDQHKEVGRKVAESVNELVTVGFRAKTIATSAEEFGLGEKHIHVYAQGEVEIAANSVAQLLKSDTVVLVKGSQSMRMERAVKALMAHPEQAADFLVRQEEEWINKK